MGLCTKKSKELYQRAVRVMIEGGSSPSRGPAIYGEYPLFIERGAGSSIFDADGNRYIDWMMAYGALPLGHAHPKILEAVQEVLSGGTHFATATKIEVEVAEQLKKIVPNAERIRFANTGTEAAMAAIRLARGYTGRPKFIKFEGHYHGWYDDFLVNAHPHSVVSLGHRNDPVKIAESSGLNRRALDDTVVVPWNDIAAVERAVEIHRGQIAAIITEGIMTNMGVIPPEEGYLPQLQQLAQDNNILFILDETVTGFRMAAGGCQELYGLEADIAIFGKALGAGFPVAAFAGRKEIMQALEWGGVLHYGTQNASRVGLYAAKASIEELTREDGAGFKHIWKLGERFSSELRGLFAETGTQAVVQGVGPMLHVFFTQKAAIHDFREFCASVDRPRYQRFALALFEQGIYMTPSACLHSVVTLAHTEEDVTRTLDAVRRVLTSGNF